MLSSVYPNTKGKYDSSVAHFIIGYCGCWGVMAISEDPDMTDMIGRLVWSPLNDCFFFLYIYGLVLYARARTFLKLQQTLYSFYFFVFFFFSEQIRLDNFM